jgi:hypothetical protein
MHFEEVKVVGGKEEGGEKSKEGEERERKWKEMRKKKLG